MNSQINYISIVENNEQNLIDAFVLTNKFFSFVDLGSRKIIREVELSDISEFKLEEDRMVIVLEDDEVPIWEGNYVELFMAFKKMEENKQ